ncbi:hypothetical protein BpHYR1_036149 [Brachionus plicatilis]|uniref:Uncharacterized protein n=1 Tax=Brachionus plicatilis TaxID=10195 RepID=A0A3M7PFQ8_BRAPC|nr:hypothetical protein BpHYR1_036149 [Brachionus plicatilis]
MPKKNRAKVTTNNTELAHFSGTIHIETSKTDSSQTLKYSECQLEISAQNKKPVRPPKKNNRFCEIQYKIIKRTENNIKTATKKLSHFFIHQKLFSELKTLSPISHNSKEK